MRSLELVRNVPSDSIVYAAASDVSVSSCCDDMSLTERSSVKQQLNTTPEENVSSNQEQEKVFMINLHIV